ncbi:MAG TPA: DegT/DnrJ/EryC1/StrS family aminotransferase [Thermoanaerobaculia bacterium]|nr:DegT/DnrJ/EryC1/StrS family aminotransferase [Thermoanaerobaculia bacterium]
MSTRSSVTSPRIPLNASTFDEDEIEAACAVLRSGFVTMGRLCGEFETAFAQHLGVRHALFVNSGSSANLLAFFALANHAAPLRGGRRRLEPGDEVIVPAVTWSTTIWPIVQAGGIPVLVDSDPETLQMDTRAAAAAVSDRTVAICPVHVLGNAVPMQPIAELARDAWLWLIEDTCEALGTRHEGRLAGTFGDLATFSFFYSHHITTIEGGMITTDDDEMAELLRCLRAHGWSRQMVNRAGIEAQYPEIDPHYLFVNTGFNLRPTEVNAAFGIHQLPKLERFNRRRVEIAESWISAFAELTAQGLLSPMRVTAGTESTWFGFPALCADRSSRDALKSHLEEQGVETRPIICGNLARQPALQHVRHRIAGSLDGADAVMDRGLYWGSHPSMSEADVQYVADTVKGFFSR